MENTQLSKLLLIFSLILGTLGQTNFAGLNIDPVLLSQADAAINDLKSVLLKKTSNASQEICSLDLFSEKLSSPFTILWDFLGSMVVHLKLCIGMAQSITQFTKRSQR